MTSAPVGLRGRGASASSSRSRSRPGRGSIRCQRSPSRIVRDAERSELAVVGRGVRVVAGAGDDVEPAAARQAVRRAFPAALQEASEERAAAAPGRPRPARRRRAPATAAPRPRPRSAPRPWSRSAVAEAAAQRRARGRAAGSRPRRPPGLSCGTKRPLTPSSICCRAPLSAVATTGEAGRPGLGDDVRHALAAREPDEDVERGEQVRRRRRGRRGSAGRRRARARSPAPAAPAHTPA